MAPRDATPNFGTNRIEALTDGLFAIVMTILVLELSLRVRTHVLNESVTTMQILNEMWPEFNNYMISFLFLGIFWILHHYQFHYIKRVDGVMVWINILFLMTVALIPFCNSVVAYLGLSHALAILYFGICSVSFLLLYISWWYAIRNRRFVDSKIKQRTIDFMKKMLIIAIIIPSSGIIISFFNVEYSFTILSLLAPFLIIFTAVGGNYLESSGRMSRKALSILIVIYFILSLVIAGYLESFLNL
ncbi:MAG: TMEM175 family protein [Candidatus Bathyarchaeota archaeon]|nr:TMEM175 family protein [Candidatus Bathyarchaeota archaeon]